jgi:hypothetical protein
MPAGVTIRVAGRGGEGIDGRARGVSWAGIVPDAGAFLGSARVVAIPSVTGGGIQVKTLDAIASGRPVVATSVALRGITDIPDHVVCSDNPEQFAKHIVRVLLEESVQAVAAGVAGWIQARQDRFARAVDTAIRTVRSTR